MPNSQTECYFENPWQRFLEELNAHSVGFKMKPQEKAFSSVKTKPSPNFAVQLAERSNHSFLLSI